MKNPGTAFTKFVLENQEIEMGKGLVGVEVGVRDGRNALDLCRFLNIKKLYLVDPFLPYFDNTRDYTLEDQEEELNKLIKNTEEYFDKVVIIRKTSKDAMDIFDDKIFDFVYIDGNHDYENIKIDMGWWDKVKIGGIFGGHDYKSAFGKYIGIVVDELAKEKNVELHDLGGRVRIPPGPGAGGVEWAIVKCSEIEKQ